MLQLRVEDVKWELPDTATFFLQEVSGKKINYQAGQFITLIFSHHREQIRRSYSLSSSPNEALLAITVKRVANGEISRFLLTKVKPGDILNAVEPAGKFTITTSETGKDIFLFAAGSGIVPIFSQLKSALNSPGNSRFILVYSNQDEKSILFKEELNKLAAQNPQRILIIYLLSSETNRLNNIKVEQLVNRNLRYSMQNAEFYCCGPFAYMRMVRLTLLYMGIEPDNIRKENFVLDTVPVSPNTDNYPPRNIIVHYRNEVHDLTVGENQSILQAALQNNIQLPYSCRMGDCSTCAAICKSGKIMMEKNDVLTDADLTAGWILTCTGHPVTDDVVVAF
jgi:ferredoxin-NADP reductase